MKQWGFSFRHKEKGSVAQKQTRGLVQELLASNTFVTLHLCQLLSVTVLKRQGGLFTEIRQNVGNTAITFYTEFAGNLYSPVELQNLSKCNPRDRANVVILRSVSRRKKEKLFNTPSTE